MNTDETSSRQLFNAASAFMRTLRRIFSLRDDTDYQGTLQQVRMDAELHGGNIWALVFAILVCSVGLNVNSTAVIIGAMLLSPLMGPIMGAGFGVATNDFELLRRSLRNLLVATAVALTVSTLYFAISPLELVQSELLARTRPTLYDVLIALFGGGAGAVAVSRKGLKGNVVPGVAIATALMPPLCTAGFGLAQWNAAFFFGALHLFLINALFIGLSTLGFARLMKFERQGEPQRTHVVRRRAIIALIAFAITIPSFYTAWSVIQETRFQQAAQRFVAENLNFQERTILSVDAKFSRKEPTITVTLLGQPVSQELSDVFQQRLKIYGLANVTLILRQPVEGQASVEQISRMVREGLLADLYKRNEDVVATKDERIRVLEDELIRLKSTEFPIHDLTVELAALYPTLVSLGLGREVSAGKAAGDKDPTVVVIASWQRLPSRKEQNRLRNFLAHRVGVESLRVVNVVAH